MYPAGSLFVQIRPLASTILDHGVGGIVQGAVHLYHVLLRPPRLVR